MTEIETADRLTKFLQGDDRDSVPAPPAGWSVTDLLPARTVLEDGTLRVRRRGRTVATIPVSTVSALAQISWGTDPVAEFASVETWVVSNEGRPLAVVGWDTRIEGQVRDAGLPVRRFAHRVDSDVIARVWPGRPTFPVAVHVDPLRH